MYKEVKAGAGTGISTRIPKATHSPEVSRNSFIDIAKLERTRSLSDPQDRKCKYTPLRMKMSDRPCLLGPRKQRDEDILNHTVLRSQPGLINSLVSFIGINLGCNCDPKLYPNMQFGVRRHVKNSRSWNASSQATEPRHPPHPQKVLKYPCLSNTSRTRLHSS